MNKPIPGFPIYTINEKGEVWRKEEELIDMMKYFKSFIVVAPYYGVNESIIRKWCRRYGLPDKVDGWK